MFKYNRFCKLGMLQSSIESLLSENISQLSRLTACSKWLPAQRRGLSAIMDAASQGKRPCSSLAEIYNLSSPPIDPVRPG